jgi:hypothetical protein
MSVSTPPPDDTWGAEFELDGGIQVRDWRYRYSGTRNSPNQTPPHKTANVSVKIPEWRQGQFQEFVNDPRFGYKGSIPALMRDAAVHRMMELVEHMATAETSPQVEAMIRRIQFEQDEMDRQAFYDHVTARKEAATQILGQMKGRATLEEVEKVIAKYRQFMQDDAWSPVLVEEMEQILVPAETAANNPLRSVR